MKLLFGPAGTGGDTYKGLKVIASKGLDCCEIQFSHGVMMKNPLAKEIGELNKELKLSLSVHAPFYINLNSKEKAKVHASKKRILDSCERAHHIGAKEIVFHAGFYMDVSKEETYRNIKKEIIDLQKTIKKNKWNVILCPETTGKGSQFGDLEELTRLAKETGCGVCVDFAHLLARYNGEMTYDEMARKSKKIKIITTHFSGVIWGPKGERMHKLTPNDETKKLLKALKKNNLSVRIINESPDTLGDAIKMKKIWKTIV
ncbi:TIM barrel protein [Nanoarchaeota archaeon]